ncbi:PREDICTED: uncharacterized protein LOC108562675, partial [Nicrophorus vespilloides]|uniref:Uncharacterized protein LOC108562675 n=1 Tax=Nicrophorus vespilloides TaxID=110193 RepID=A0ABM1MPT5_NICVS
MNFPVLLLLFLESAIGKLEESESELCDEMIAYIWNTKISLADSFDTVGLLGTTAEYSSDIVSYMLKHRFERPILIGNRDLQYWDVDKDRPERTKNLFCFVETYNHFEVMIQLAKEMPFFVMTGFIQFIIATPVPDRTWLNSTLEYLSRNKVINFVVVYKLENRIEVIGYNPFNKSIYNFTNHKKGISIYPPKLSNLYGSKIYISFIPDAPRNIIVGDRLMGEDFNWIPILEEKMNAAVEYTIVNSYNLIKEELQTGVTNFSLARHFTYPRHSAIIESGYPSRMDFVAIAVPSAELMPQFKYLFLVFEIHLWVIIILVVVIMCVIYNVLWKATGEQMCVEASTFLVIQCFLSNANAHCIRGQSPIKMLMTSWIYFSLLLSIAFNTALRDSLMILKYGKNINSLEELARSGLTLMGEHRILDVLMEAYPPIADQIIGSYNVSGQLMEYTQREIGFILPNSVIKLVDHKKDENGRFYFHVLEEYLMPGHSVYNFPNNSIFREEIDHIMMLSREFGLFSYNIK